MDWTVGALRKRVNDEMEKHMNGLVPAIQLDSEYCDIFPHPEPPDDTTAMQELGAKQLTMIVWPKKTEWAQSKPFKRSYSQPPVRDWPEWLEKQTKVQHVTTSQEHEILVTKLFEQLHNSSGPVGVALLEKLCQKVAELQDTIESLLCTTKEQQHIIEKQANQLEEQAKKLEEQALRINELKQQIKDLEEKHAQQFNELPQQHDKNRVALNDLQGELVPK
ncbi:hypothetical protein L211DRAFT_845626 [Terfezia boudieri ATCC MYA-4762]|uniref:Uncharacterized protein n=1 Tax=Terfezia boudieri ATCC MYA-4762 TaxID=1051890 RepID=A0A3N4M0A5_9PEZI|nr:hypothetical protein L211DRAFT_845626 [Terfezia boudieri ATCC MYA-4762]